MDRLNPGRSAILPGAVALLAAAVLVLPGCKTVESAAAIPGKTMRAVVPGQEPKRVIDPVEVQQALLQVCGGFTLRAINGINELRQVGTGQPIAQEEILRWKLALGTEMLNIASGANPVAGLIDMAVVVTLLRATVEERWVPEQFGESAQPMLATCRMTEQQIWSLVERVLEPEQITRLRAGIEKWREENPFPASIVGMRAVGFASHLTKTDKGGLGLSDTLKSLVSLDPFAGLDPTTREITQTRLFAERALYVAQRTPELLRWQMELLSIEVARTPAVEQLLADSARVSTSVERFAGVAEQLPAQLTAALGEQEKQLTPMVREVHQTLAAGAAFSTALDAAIRSLDALMKRFGVGEPKPEPAPGDAAAPATAATGPAGPPAPPPEPFRISDYGRTAEQLEGAARQLTELIRTLDGMLGSQNLSRLADEAAPVVDHARESGREIVDRAFWRGVTLVLVVFAAAIVYRFVTRRWLAPPARESRGA